MWQVTGVTWHVTHYPWHMTLGVGWTFSQNFSSLALPVWDWQCLEDIWTKGSLTHSQPRLYRVWAFSHEKSKKKCKFEKELSYRLWSFEPLFSTNLWFWGNFLIILVLALERKIAKKWMLMINFFHFFFCTRSTKNNIGHNIGIYFQNFV